MYTRGYLHSIINVEQIIKRMEKIAIGAWVILILILTGGIVIAPIAILVGLGIILMYTSIDQNGVPWIKRSIIE